MGISVGMLTIGITWVSFYVVLADRLFLGWPGFLLLTWRGIYERRWLLFVASPHLDYYCTK